MTISFTSMSAGCSIANATARAIASGGIANLSREVSSWAFTSGLVTAAAKFVRTKPGEMIVTRSLSPASWRKPSEMARTANFVPEQTDWLGTVLCPVVGAVLTKCPKPCLRKTGSAAAMPYRTPFDVDVDHLLPIRDAQVVEGRNR